MEGWGKKCLCVVFWLTKRSRVRRNKKSFWASCSVEKNPSITVHRVTDSLFFLKSAFNFSQTVGEMVFVSFEVEKMRMFFVQSVVRWCWVLERSWGAVVSFPV